jgi:hypothetical protein
VPSKAHFTLELEGPWQPEKLEAVQFHFILDLGCVTEHMHTQIDGKCTSCSIWHQVDDVSMG